MFADAVASGGAVRGLRVEGGARFSRKDVDDLAAVVAPFGARGLAPIWVEETGIRSPIAKFFSADAMAALVGRMAAAPGDLLLFLADRLPVVEAGLGALRVHLAERMSVPREGWSFLWVVDFPMFEEDEREHRLKAQHHPFTKPRLDRPEDLQEKPLELGTYAYDLVLNGVELGSGSIRIADPALQEAVFRTLGTRPGGDRGEVRLPGGSHGLRDPSPWRHGARTGPHRHAHGRGIVYPRSHRVPEDPERLMPPDRCAFDRVGRSTQGAAVENPLKRASVPQVAAVVAGMPLC